MIRHDAIDDDDLRRLIVTGHIRYGGNRRLRIYGRLDCALGKRMKRASRVFFGDADEARRGRFSSWHCLRDDYARWKDTRRRGIWQSP
ncbi:MAG: hypothetical protein CM15mP115_16340 [Alphaproteobacteria bacterium]|nr:MAG: hypothetical protein CM15mP115_16340 [Alphaproteobacteria bacterium]